MDFEWDEDKARENLSKHGAAFESIVAFDWATALIARDERRDYGEPRFVSFGFIGNRLFACVYTQRGNTRRIISLRKANRREETFYEESTQASDK